MTAIQVSSFVAAPRVVLRSFESGDSEPALAIINMAARAYLGSIPEDQWHDPFMSALDFETELRAGVSFWVAEVSGMQVGVMGVEPKSDVDLIRHAYVLPSHQGLGIGGALLGLLMGRCKRPLLVGTWAAAKWAVRFYQRHGFVLESDDKRRAELLQRYWRVSLKQMQSAVVLSLEGVTSQTVSADDGKIH